MRKEEGSSGAQISISARHYVITHMTPNDVKVNNSIRNGERFYGNSKTFRILDEDTTVSQEASYRRDIYFL